MPSEPAATRTWPKRPLWPAPGRSGSARATAPRHQTAGWVSFARRVLDADARHAHPTRERAPRLEQEAELREADRQGLVGLHGGTAHLARVGAQPRRQVHGQHAGRRASRVDRLDPPGARGVHVPAQAGAEECVDDDVALSRLERPDLGDAHRQRPRTGGPGVALPCVGADRGHHLDRHPAQVEMPCRHPAIAAVVASTGHHAHAPSAREHAGRAPSDVLARHLHQELGGHAPVLDRAPIEFPHLGGSDERPAVDEHRGKVAGPGPRPGRH